MKILLIAIILALTVPANAMGPMLHAMGPYNMACPYFNKTKGVVREKALAYAHGIVAQLNMAWWDSGNEPIDLQERYRKVNRYIIEGCNPKNENHHRTFISSLAAYAFNKMTGQADD